MSGAEDLTFASARIDADGNVHVHYARCEPCMLGAHYGGPHDWAGPEDIEGAKALGLPDPTGLRCACDCCDEPLRNEEPEPDESLNAPPCPTCGEAGACAYDSEGRALIHAITEED